MMMVAVEITFRTKEGFSQDDGRRYWENYESFTLTGRHLYRVTTTIQAVNFLGAMEVGICGVLSSDPRIEDVTRVEAWEIQPEGQPNNVS